ncbi:MAG: outer membrane lipoprotein carrier protein LolA [Saprospiraceae bacterium]|nr:outer membrane lipoprotein carrier protein LolA [Saprospiraceae bacterium]
MMKMTWQFLLSGLMIIGGHYLLIAQDVSDPSAKKILKEMKAHYSKNTASAYTLRMTVAYPEQDPQITNGQLTQNGEQYQLDLGQQSWYCNGKTVWIHLKDQKEVQIHSASASAGSESFLTPQSILNRFDNGDYIYALGGTGVENKKAVRYIDFKPKDRNDEFVKLRLSVASKSPEVVKFEAFSRDGSRYTLDILSVKSPVSTTPAQFAFNPKAHPGIHVEDLRID